MLTAVTITRLEKAATDNGFDIELEHAPDWLCFASSQTAMRIWLAVDGESRLLAAASRADVLDELAGLGAASADRPPSGAAGAVLPSDALSPDTRAVLGLDESLEVHGLHRAHERYLPWHRSRIFRNRGGAHRS